MEKVNKQYMCDKIFWLIDRQVRFIALFAHARKCNTDLEGNYLKSSCTYKIIRTYFFGIFHSICIIGKHFCTKSIIYQPHENVDLETKQESNTSFREMLLSDT